MSDQPVLHRAEEHGQSRELKGAEVGAHTLMAGIESAALACGAGIAVVTIQGVQGQDISILTALATGGVVGGLAFYFHVAQNLGELRDGLRMWRSVETFAPPQPGPSYEPPHPPIMVKPYGGEPYTIGSPERPALPGREEALQLTPPVVAEILKASLEQYGGEWSRRKLMALRVSGQRVSRGMYEELTTWLNRAGFLQQSRTGGFTLPPDVQEFEDLRRYLPSLPGLGDLGTPPLPIPPTFPPIPPSSPSLAERRRQRYIELGCDATAYLEWRKSHDG